MEPMMVVQDLTKRYGDFLAVDRLSFSVESGVTLGLLGPNGAGKSTTIRMLMGLTRPSGGEISVFGLKLETALKKIQSQIGVVFEKPNLMEDLSAYQNLALACKLYDRPLSLIPSLLERMGLSDRAKDPVKTFSKGMRQRVLVIRALVHQPQLLFLDEPCSGLDPVSARIIRDYLAELKQNGVTIILTSHDMAEVDELCDLIGFVNHGKLVVLDEPRRLKTAYGKRALRVSYYQGSELCEVTVEPSPETMNWLAELYQADRVAAVHSTEASLDEIFRRLSEVS